MQTSDAVLMVRPTQFGFNTQTATSNTYQLEPTQPERILRDRALAEFEALRDRLVRAGVRVVVFDSDEPPRTPDAVFPNNWFSLHEDGTLVLYPMAAPNRRAERRPRFVAALRDRLSSRVIDLTHFEAQGKYLEGTGSLVLDHRNRIAYAALSVRTHPEVVEAFASALEYRPILFSTRPVNGQPAYHTNVVLSVGESASVACLEAIADSDQRDAVEASLRASGRPLIRIGIDQMNQFAANLLELRAKDGTYLWVMSTRAHDAFSAAQRQQLAATSRLVHVELSTIESIGGGSARCMLAELFTPPARPLPEAWQS